MSRKSNYLFLSGAFAIAQVLSAQSTVAVHSAESAQFEEGMPIVGASVSTKQAPFSDEFSQMRVIKGDSGKRVSKTTLPAASGDVFDVADTIVIGKAVSTTAHLTSSGGGVYTVIVASVEQVLKGNISTNQLVSFLMPGGAVEYPSGHIQSVKPEGLGFPQLGHTVLLVGKGLDSSHVRLLFSYIALNGTVHTIAGLRTGTDDTKSISDLSTSCSTAFAALVATEDVRVPLLDLHHPQDSVGDPADRSKRHASNINYFTLQTPYPRLPHYRVGGGAVALPINLASEILIAHVSSMSTYALTDGSGVYSVYKVIPSQLLVSAGEVSPNKGLDVEVMGGVVRAAPGQVDIFGSYGVALLEPGADYVLFLHRAEFGRAYELAASYRILDGRIYSSNRSNEIASQFDGITLTTFELKLRNTMSDKADGVAHP